MKIKKISKATNVTEKNSPLSGKELVVYHQQSFKQSANYQSADCAYGVTVTIGKDDSLEETIKELESIVETRLVAKMSDQRQALEMLAK